MEWLVYRFCHTESWSGCGAMKRDTEIREMEIEEMQLELLDRTTPEAGYI